MVAGNNGKQRGATMELNSMEDFSRDLRYHVRRNDEGQIILTAHLLDCFHDVRMEIITNYEDLAIVAAKVDFIRHPSPDCPHVAVRMERLIGFVIGKGLNRKVQEAFGGSEGCGNLRVMLFGLLPLALNVKAASGYRDNQELLDGIGRQLAGSCGGYIKR